MRTHDQFMDSLEPIFTQLAGSPLTPRINVFHTCKEADFLPPGCDGCRVDLAGNLICCVNQKEEE